MPPSRTGIPLPPGHQKQKALTNEPHSSEPPSVARTDGFPFAAHSTETNLILFALRCEYFFAEKSGSDIHARIVQSGHSHHPERRSLQRSWEDYPLLGAVAHEACRLSRLAFQ